MPVYGVRDLKITECKESGNSRLTSRGTKCIALFLALVLIANDRDVVWPYRNRLACAVRRYVKHYDQSSGIVRWQLSFM